MSDTKEEAPPVLAPPPAPWVSQDGSSTPSRTRALGVRTAPLRQGPAPLPEGSLPEPSSLVERRWSADGESRGRLLHRVGWWVLAAAGCAFLLVSLLKWWDVGAHEGRVVEGVFVGPVAVGGMTSDEARAAIAAHAAQLTSQHVPATLAGGEVELEPSALGFGVDVEASVAAAMAVGREHDAVSSLFDWAQARLGSRHVDLVSNLDEAAAVAAINAVEFDGKQVPVEPEVSIADDGTVQVDDPVVGKQIVTDAALPRLKESLSRLPHTRIELTVAEIQPRYTADDAAAAVDAAEDIRHKEIEVEIEGIATSTIKPLDIADMIHGIPTTDGYRVGIDDASLQKGLRGAMGTKAGSKAEEAKFDLSGGQINHVEGKPGFGCCVEGSAAKFEQALRNGDGHVVLQPGEAQPTRTVADLQKLGQITKLSEFTTRHPCCESRVQNIHKASDIIRSEIVKPGEQFSMNEVLGGQRRRSDGWAMAPSIVDGDMTKTPGGGISQVATTLYNALYFAGIQVDEHKAHSHWIPRYPKGREATLGYPWPDLKFTNDMADPVVIWTSYSGESVTVSIWGKGDGRTVSEEGPEIGRYGSCQVVSRWRTITWPDGREKKEKVRTIYDSGNPCVPSEAKSPSKGED